MDQYYTRRFRRFLVLFVIALLLISSKPDFADSNTPFTSTGAPVGQSALGTVPPVSVPSFSGGLGTGAANLFANCGSSTASSTNALASQILKLKKTAPTSVATSSAHTDSIAKRFSCNMTDCKKTAKVDFSSAGCDLIETDGKLDSGKFKDDMCQLACAEKADESKVAELQEIKDNLDCLSKGSAELLRQMQSTQGAYTQVLQAAQKATAALSTAEQGRADQMAQVESKLSGDPKTKVPGLVDIQSLTLTMVSAMSGEIQGIVNAHHDLDIAQKQYERGVQDETMAQAVQCFNNDTSGGNTCYPGGPIVSLAGYVACRVGQNYQVSTGGTLEQDATTKQESEAVQSQLQNILDQISGQAPSLSTPAADAAQAAANAAKPSQLSTVSDIERNYGQSLSTIDELFAKNGRMAMNESVHDFVISSYGDCFKTANKNVQRDVLNPNKVLYQKADLIKNQTRNLEAQVDPLILKYQTALATNLSTMTGVVRTFDVAPNCKDPTQGDQQISCLNQMKGLLNDQLLGGGSSPVLGLPLSGNPYIKPINIQCKGLNGCITELQKMDKSLDVDRKAIHTSKQKLIQQVNQQVETLTTTLTNAYSGPASMLSTQIAAIEKKLADLKVTASITKTKVTAETLEKSKSTTTDANGNSVDEDGLYKIPNSVYNVLAGKIGLIDVNGDVFSSATGAVATAQTNIEEDEGKLATSDSNLQGLFGKCKKELIKDAFTSFQTDFNAARDACAITLKFCTGTPLSDLTNTLKNINPVTIKGIDAGDISNLDTGLKHACEGEKKGCLKKTVVTTGGDGKPISTADSPLGEDCTEGVKADCQAPSEKVQKSLRALTDLNGQSETSGSAKQ